MFTALDTTPLSELTNRHTTCQKLMQTLCPEAAGLMVFSKVSIYYLTGTLASGIVWLPAHGSPMLFVRKGMERAALESPIKDVFSYKSYGDLLPILQQHGANNLHCIACEKSALPWSFADNLTKKFPSTTWVAGDTVLSQARSVKSAWELTKIEQAGAMHSKALCQELPKRLRVGMSEHEIASALWDICFTLGHPGIMRMTAFGEEQFLGHISVGNNGNYPTYYNGPLGLQGEHPAAPVMGHHKIIWQKNMVLSIDTGFACAGYHSDKTQVYFSGSASDIPAIVRKAQDVCLEIEHKAASLLKTGAIPAHIYNAALTMADQAGFAEGFMGLGGNKVPFLGHSIGLTVDEWPVLANKFEVPLETGTVMAIEPKIGLPGIGMVGTENIYATTESGGRCLSGKAEGIICIE